MAVAAEFPCLRRIREIPRKQGNSTATAKIRGSARNSAGRGKLWALLIIIIIIMRKLIVRQLQRIKHRCITKSVPVPMS